MNLKTPLDRLWQALGDAPGEAALRRYYQALLAADLLLPVDSAEGERFSPRLLAVEGQDFAMAFDSEARLAAFFEDGTERVELPGSVLADLLQGEALGLALNPGLEEGQYFLDPETVRWLAQGSVMQAEKHFTFAPVGELPPHVLAQILDAVGTLSGRAGGAILCGTDSDQLVLALVNAPEELAQELAPLLAVIDAGPIELLFPDAAEVKGSDIERFGLALEIPKPEAPRSVGAPGTDPDKPPRLR